MICSVLINTYGIFIINGLGNTALIDITLYHGDLEIFYINYEFTAIQRYSNHTLYIAKFKFSDNTIPKNATAPKSLLYTIMVEFWQECYKTEVYIQESLFQSLRRIEMISITFLDCRPGNHLVIIERCQFF